MSDRRAPVLLALVAVIAAGCGGTDLRATAEREPEVAPVPDSSDTGPEAGSGAPTPSDETSSPAGPTATPTPYELAFEPVAEHVPVPTSIAGPSDGELLVVAALEGLVFAVDADGTRDEPFLDLRDVVATGGERGLFGVAFHPDYADNGRVFVSYTAQPDGRSVVEEYRRAAGDAWRADPATARTVLEVAQPSPIHNGGMLAFGPHDGYLYLSLGDGGPSGDPAVSPQDPRRLLGSILRLDVDGGQPYAIPPDNPFADGRDGAGREGAPEVWAYGLRNPWRFDFDPTTGDLYVADVGQSELDELDVLRPSDAGANLGWPILEGDRCYQASTCDPTGLHPPVLTSALHGDEGNCALIGGAVIRDAALHAHQGLYLHSDHCAAWVRGVRVRGTVTETVAFPDLALERPVTYGRDGQGRLYVGDGDGRIYRLVPRPTQD